MKTRWNFVPSSAVLGTISIRAISPRPTSRITNAIRFSVILGNTLGMHRLGWLISRAEAAAVVLVTADIMTYV
jgi:hypothetical protein